MRAVFLGRFQPFHSGHHAVVEELRGEYEDFLIAVGSAETEGTGENPLSFEERREIIENCFPEIQVLGIEDRERTEEGNRDWVLDLEDITGADTVVSGNELVQRLVDEHTGMEVREPEQHEPSIYSGTEIRRRIRSGEEWRYLVPDCAVGKVEGLVDKIEESGREYDFTPGWKKENASR